MLKSRFRRIFGSCVATVHSLSCSALRLFDCPAMECRVSEVGLEMTDMVMFNDDRYIVNSEILSATALELRPVLKQMDLQGSVEPVSPWILLSQTSLTTATDVAKGRVRLGQPSVHWYI